MGERNCKSIFIRRVNRFSQWHVFQVIVIDIRNGIGVEETKLELIVHRDKDWGFFGE